jgi:hypothetical protein
MTIPSLVPGQRLHHWQIVSIDNRRVTARCRCGEIKTIAVESLIEGHCTSCGCSTPTPAKMQALREGYEDQKRRKNFSWRLERGR